MPTTLRMGYRRLESDVELCTRMRLGGVHVSNRGPSESVDDFATRHGFQRRLIEVIPE